jgi:uncharacterized membrane protein YfcA
MQIYLPIAEMSVNILLLLGMGAGVGLLSGMFGVGGGFLMTPLLIILGVPPAVAVGTEANQVVAASASGFLAHMRRGNVDFRMGSVLLAGGMAGSALGVWLFFELRQIGQIDLVIELGYTVFLAVIGTLMLVESIRTLLHREHGRAATRGAGRHTWVHGLPLKMRFRKSKLYISALLPLTIGFVVGVLAAILGVGGGIVMLPAMIYILGMPTSVVVGTSLFQIVFVTASATFLHAYNNQTVDIVLAALLLLGAVVGAQYGSKIGTLLRGEQLRALLALVVLVVTAKLLYGLVATPEEMFTLSPIFKTP